MNSRGTAHAQEPPARVGAHWWCQETAQLLQALETSPLGLTAAQARQRLSQTGVNRLTAAPRLRLLNEVGRRLRNPLLVVLLAAVAASVATGQGMSAWILAVMVLLGLVLDQVQQHRAQAAATRLSDSVALHATVLRAGAQHSQRVASLVPGDVVLLSAGSMVPADGVLLSAHDLFVQQSALTGESFPVEKRPGASPPDSTMEESAGALFMGSSVLSGQATMLVCATGMRTQAGAMSHLMGADRGDLAFDNHLRQFGTFIMRLTLVLVLLVLLVGGLMHRAWLESFMFALALAVGLTPELLPMVVTVSLSRGALRLARAHVIVKRLSAIHNLGSMDVLCTDKTGTLTDARIELVRHVDIAAGDSAAVLENAFLNSRFETGLRTPLEEAILAHGGVDAAPWRKIDEVPFDFERRRVSVLVDRTGERRLTVKGAPADVLAHCDRWQEGEHIQFWTTAARSRAEATLEKLESQGLRVLGVACKPVPRSLEDATLKDESELVFAGFAAFLDPPKKDAAAALAGLLAAGVEVKV